MPREDIDEQSPAAQVGSGVRGIAMTTSKEASAAAVLVGIKNHNVREAALMEQGPASRKTLPQRGYSVSSIYV
ncbi:hypothetical protein J2Y41_003905 [Arthrobacter sp. 1088]|uniref:hypothetical protein n=1 Tax=Arthrobacter sp. 1088 TaxID=2817768 RepID=UPI002865C093|nr:hypothetical protein [Arthrobacter sp. 1088]MDR6688319.1 hypothetical protein [Arthrobacter sp. 1088]